MVVEDSLSPNDQVGGFLLAEYELLKDLRAGIITQNENRLNLFMAVVSGSAGLIAFIIKEQVCNSKASYIAALFIILWLLLFGLTAYKRLIDGVISITIYSRGLNRIRRYFLDVDQAIADYLMLPVNDDVPRFGTVGFLPTKWSGIGLAWVVIIVNSILIGGILAIILHLVTRITSWLIILIGVLAILALIAHYVYYKHQMEKARRSTVVMFPGG